MDAAATALLESGKEVLGQLPSWVDQAAQVAEKALDSAQAVAVEAPGWIEGATQQVTSLVNENTGTIFSVMKGPCLEDGGSYTSISWLMPTGEAGGARMGCLNMINPGQGEMQAGAYEWGFGVGENNFLGKVSLGLSGANGEVTPKIEGEMARTLNNQEVRGVLDQLQEAVADSGKTQQTGEEVGRINRLIQASRGEVDAGEVRIVMAMSGSGGAERDFFLKLINELTGQEIFKEGYAQQTPPMTGPRREQEEEQGGQSPELDAPTPGEAVGSVATEGAGVVVEGVEGVEEVGGAIREAAEVATDAAQTAAEATAQVMGELVK